MHDVLWIRRPREIHETFYPTKINLHGSPSFLITSDLLNNLIKLVKLHVVNGLSLQNGIHSYYS